jgi:hypothetical protein
LLGDNEGVQLRFTDQGLEVDSVFIAVEMGYSSLAISNAAGELIFYTNGCDIYNASHERMLNGNDINPGTVHELQCNQGPSSDKAYTAGNQSTIGLPAPGDDDLYYLLHKRIEIYTDGGLDVRTDKLLYTEIDLTLDEGLGGVTNKNISLVEDTLSYDYLTAVKHANGNDWWIITPQYVNNRYYTWLLDTAGFHGPYEQAIGLPYVRQGEGSGQANFSPDGRLYARYNPYDDVHLYDFDRTTGLLSNFRQLTVPEVHKWAGGLAFSPNSRYLYISSTEQVFQFDLAADDIEASRLQIAQYDSIDFFIQQSFYQLQLGPDCRIYNFCPSCEVLHVIQHPDSAGLAAGFEQGAIELPAWVFRSMPHYPNYRLGPLGAEGLPCEPIVVDTEEPVPEPPAGALRVYPNPSRGSVTLATPAGAAFPAGTGWELYDGRGRRVRSVLPAGGAARLSVELPGLPAGLYFWRWVDRRGRTLGTGKLVLAR